jgi:hypothetical protein
MSVFVRTATKLQAGTAWTGTAPGDPGTQTISGTITSAKDFSPFLSSGIDVNFGSDQIDFSNMASGGFKKFLPGLTEAGELTIPLHADMTASTGVNAMLQTISGNNLGITRPGDSEVYFDVMATSESRGTSNPSFVFAANIAGYKPLVGGVGEKAVGEITLRPTGAFAILTS